MIHATTIGEVGVLAKVYFEPSEPGSNLVLFQLIGFKGRKVRCVPNFCLLSRKTGHVLVTSSCKVDRLDPHWVRRVVVSRG